MQFLAKVLSTATLVAASYALQAQTLVEKADKQYELHAYRLAAQSYETILAREADDVNVMSHLADSYFHLNELDNAARWYSKAIKTGKAQPAAVLNYGKVLMMLGLYTDAETQFIAYKKHDLTAANNYIKSCRFAIENESNAGDLTVTPLSKSNTGASDFGIAVFNNQLIWSSSRTDMKRDRETASRNDWTGAAQNQLFTALVDNATSKATFLRSDLKNIYNESNPTFSSDGKTVVFMRNNFDDGERISSNGGMEFSLYTANVNEQGNWSDVRAFTHNGTGFSTGFPALSPDGKNLYFASNRGGGQGGFDIYVCSKRGNIWGEPRNLGASVNTPGDEITPFFDGKTLYFSSDFQTGYGGFDIFKTEGMASEAVNMGSAINSSGDDFGYIFDPSVKTGYFVSNRKGGKGKEDIYKVTQQSESANIVVVENGKPLKDVKVSVAQGNAKSLTALKSGNFILDLNDGKTYSLEVKKEGYKAKTIKVEPLFDKSSRVIEVALEKDVPTEMSVVPQYKGTVTDGSNSQNLEGVVIKATNQTNSTQLEATTDNKGQYSLNLSPKTSYLITYSKEGFVIGKKTIKTSDITDKNLGGITLKPSAVSDKNELIASTEKGPKAINQPTSVPKVYNSTPSEVTEKGAKEHVYSVQMLVSSNDDVLSVTKYDNLKSLGNVYVVPEDGKQKVRIGVYQSRDEANAVLAKVKENVSASAYIVEEKNSKAITAHKFTPAPKVEEAQEVAPVTTPKSEDIPAEYDTPVKPKGATTTPTKTTIKKEEPKKTTPAKTTPAKASATIKTQPQKVDGKKPAKPVVTAPVAPVKKDVKPATQPAKVVEKKAVIVEDKSFKVKIASMKKPEWFDDSKVATLWKIDKVKEGDLTIFIMDGFKTLQQAKELKNKVKAAGYKDAKVVVREGEKFKVVD